MATCPGPPPPPKPTSATSSSSNLFPQIPHTAAASASAPGLLAADSSSDGPSPAVPALDHPIPTPIQPDPASAPQIVDPKPKSADPSSSHSTTPHNLPDPKSKQPPLLPIPHQVQKPLPPAPNPPPLSYAQVARAPRGPGFVRSHAAAVESFARIPHTGLNVICGTREGIPSFSFVNSDLSKVEGLYSKALVMKFLRGRPSLEASHTEILSWGIESPITIGPLTSKSFLLRFQEERDLLKVLTRPSTTLITFPYKIFRWHNQCHLNEDSCITPVWISLPRLPLQCFVPEFLESIANRIGRFLCIDKATATLARPSAARLCVELDLRKTPPQFIWIGLFEGIKQQIIYEKMPKFCTGCYMQGHSTLECSRRRLDAPSIPSDTRLSFHPQRPQGARPNASLAHNSGFNKSKTFPGFSVTPSHAQQPHSSIPTGSTSRPPSFQPTVPTPNLVNPSRASTAPPPQPGTNLAAINTQRPDPQPSPNPTVLIPVPGSNDPQNQTGNPSINNRPSNDHPHAPSKPANQIFQKQTKPKKNKSVVFAHQQLNLETNQEYWDAVNRQMAILEQARLKASASARNAAPPPNPSVEHPSASGPTVHQSTPLGDETSPYTSTDEESRPASPLSSFLEGQDPYDSLMKTNYHSEGEDPTEPLSLQGHNSDDSLSFRPQSIKRNKRHPDQPLKVQLRGRKDPKPSSHD